MRQRPPGGRERRADSVEEQAASRRVVQNVRARRLMRDGRRCAHQLPTHQLPCLSAFGSAVIRARVAGLGGGRAGVHPGPAITKLTRQVHGRVMRRLHDGRMDQLASQHARRALQPVMPAQPDQSFGRPQSDSLPMLRLGAVWARHADDVLEAQRLRHQVFVGEMGARLQVPPGTPAGLDVDTFDPHCEHLLVRIAESDAGPARVVGTYRVLTAAAARRAGGLYSEQEFDLSPLDALRPRIAELGRSCTDPAFRQGGVILMLWSALAGFMQRNGLDLTVGCASVPMADGGHAAASLWQQLRGQHLAAPALCVQPRLPLPVASLRSDLPVQPPPLIKGYLKCGGRLLGPPAWDPAFGTADLPMLLDLADLPAAYRRRFTRG